MNGKRVKQLKKELIEKLGRSCTKYEFKLYKKGHSDGFHSKKKNKSESN